MASGEAEIRGAYRWHGSAIGNGRNRRWALLFSGLSRSSTAMNRGGGGVKWPMARSSSINQRAERPCLGVVGDRK